MAYITPIKLENIDHWLQPSPNDLARFCEIPEDREWPYYAHVSGFGAASKIEQEGVVLSLPAA